MDVNAVVLTGRLGADPELRSAGEASICEFSLAVGGREKRNGQWEDTVSWVDVKVWGRQGENAHQYLAKGRQVAISGRLRQERWSAKDGTKRSKLVVTADRVQFLGTRDSEPDREPASTSSPHSY